MKLLLTIALTFPLYYGYSQPVDDPATERVALTIGILQGGGSLVGADLEALITSRLGLQVGGGFRGFGGAVNFHLRPTIRSFMISLTYWHQGFGSYFAQEAMGPTFVYRSKQWFTAQLGLGVPLSRGPALPEDFTQPPVMLLYSIGAYLPFQ